MYDEIKRGHNKGRKENVLKLLYPEYMDFFPLGLLLFPYFSFKTIFPRGNCKSSVISFSLYKTVFIP